MKARPTRAPKTYEVSDLAPADLETGLLEALATLSDLEGLTAEGALEVLDERGRAPSYHVFVAREPSGRVVGTTTLVVERKLIHNGGFVGHIEDVAVAKGHQGKGVGRALVEAAVRRAERLGCYKCILDCKPELVGFYERLGFKRHDVGMRKDLKPRKKP